jgi:hypothetical protein
MGDVLFRYAATAKTSSRGEALKIVAVITLIGGIIFVVILQMSFYTRLPPPPISGFAGNDGRASAHEKIANGAINDK